MPKVYPEKDSPAAESPVDEVKLGQDMINIMEEGCTLEYSKKSRKLGRDDDNNIIYEMKVGDELERPHVTALAQAGRDIPVIARRVYEEIMSEKKALSAITPRDYDTKAKFAAALDAVCHHIARATWVQKLEDKYEVSTWAELKELFPTVETM